MGKDIPVLSVLTCSPSSLSFKPCLCSFGVPCEQKSVGVCHLSVCGYQLSNSDSTACLRGCIFLLEPWGRLEEVRKGEN